MVSLRGTLLRLKNFPIILIGGNGDAITTPAMQHLWSIVTRTVFGMFVTAVDWNAPLEGPESLLLDEIEAGFDELERQGAGLSIIDPELDRNEITVAQAEHHRHMKKIFICTEVGMGQHLSGIQRQ
ncbi:hypothetical protein JB92DRAFT_2828441 [Gautieria morchelliformis]|nr:hypothetical protein JB92DRAFT_2828441 [Gautieria morchelliformis]